MKPTEEFKDESQTPSFSSGEAEKVKIDKPITLTSFLSQNRSALNDSIKETNKLKKPPVPTKAKAFSRKPSQGAPSSLNLV